MLDRRDPHRLTVVKRLSNLTALTNAAVRALVECVEDARSFDISRPISLLSDADRPLLLVDGWAARARTFGNGGRQFVDVVLPGETIFPIDRSALPLVALTKCKVCLAPDTREHPSLQRAINQGMQLQLSYAYSQIARVGTMTASDRILDLLSELYERAVIAGLVIQGTLETPLTQRHIGDMTALTSVHVNRMLKSSPQDADVRWINRNIVVRTGSAIDLAARANADSIQGNSVYIRRDVLLKHVEGGRT